MKKVVKFASLLLVGGTLIFTSCGKKKDDAVTPNPVPSTPSCDGGSAKTKQVIIDNSTSTSTYVTGYNQNVTKCDGSAIIYLDVKASKDMDKIYMTLSQDNGPSSPVFSGDQDGFAGSNSKTSAEADGTPKKTFKAGSSSNGYTLDIPDLGGGLTSTSYIKVPVVVPIRNSDAATTDVYTIWITNGNGSFNSPGTRTVIGPIVVTLNYKGTSSATYVQASGLLLGDQTATPPSYLATRGQITPISGGDIYAGLTDATEKQTALNGTDINFISISSDGTIYGNSCGTATGAKPYFISAGLRSSLNPSGCLSNTEGTVMTKFATYSGTDFATISASQLSSLPTPTADRVEVTEGGVYVFKTADGRKGLIKAYSLTKSSSGKLNATVKVDVKVATM